MTSLSKKSWAATAHSTAADLFLIAGALERLMLPWHHRVKRGWAGGNGGAGLNLT